MFTYHFRIIAICEPLPPLTICHFETHTNKKDLTWTKTKDINGRKSHAIILHYTYIYTHTYILHYKKRWSVQNKCSGAWKIAITYWQPNHWITSRPRIFKHDNIAPMQRLSASKVVWGSVCSSDELCKLQI